MGKRKGSWFMSISISNSFSTPSIAAVNSSATAAAAQKVQQTANDSVDTVKLTESQQVHQLYNQGQPVSLIASSLSLTVDTVNNYLGISGTTG
jgi:DNA-binding NarL/FixJ family response regulator